MQNRKIGVFHIYFYEIYPAVGLTGSECDIAGVRA